MLAGEVLDFRQQPLVLIKVVKPHRLLRIRQQLDRARQPLELAPLHGLLQLLQQVSLAILCPSLGSKRLDAISNEQVQRLKLALANRAPKTVNNVLTVLSTLGRRQLQTLGSRIARSRPPAARSAGGAKRSA